MKSTDGKHYLGLDQIRGVAAFLVFVWHFLCARGNPAIPLDGTFDFIGNSLLAQGHTGVAMFMVLSGYLFAKLAHGKLLLIGPFLFNRMMRLAPLMIAVIVVRIVLALLFEPGDLMRQLAAVPKGLIAPTWPNGGWSIAVELHFYILFPFLLVLLRKHPLLLLGVVLGAILMRAGIYELLGGHKLQRFAYLTIVGRIDQFVMGMLFAQISGRMAGKHGIAAVVAIVWLFAWSEFTRLGGYYGNDDHQWVWIFVSTGEAVAYGALIAYYDRTFNFAPTGFSWLVAKFGEWSFSIYLLHRFIVGDMAKYIDAHVLALDNLYVAVAFSIPCFLVTAFFAWISYEQYEKRFLRNRRPYLVKPAEAAPTPPARALPDAV